MLLVGSGGQYIDPRKGSVVVRPQAILDASGGYLNALSFGHGDAIPGTKHVDWDSGWAKAGGVVGTGGAAVVLVGAPYAFGINRAVWAGYDMREDYLACQSGSRSRCLNPADYLHASIDALLSMFPNRAILFGSWCWDALR